MSLIDNSHSLQNFKKFEKWFCLFIGEIINLKLGYYVPATKAFNSFKTLLECPDLMNYIEISDSNSIQDHLLSLDEEELLKSEFLINILKYIEGNIEENLFETVFALQEVPL